MKPHFLLLSSFFFTLNVFCQQSNFTNNDQHYQIHIKKSNEPIVIDGELNEAAWQSCDVAQNFWQTFPLDTGRANVKTEARVCFDDNFLYVAGKCYEHSTNYVVTSLKRDFQGGTTDLFGINIDAFKDRLNGFNFAVSPLGVQREGLIANGLELSTDWDNKWYAQVKHYNGYWVVEMAIPFKTLRYKSNKGTNEWLVNFLRFDQTQKQPERSCWAPVPRNQPGNALAFSGTMLWNSPPPKPGANIAVIPYLLADTDRDFLNKKPTRTNGNVGVDTKIAITPSLNLDLTLNPDFAQVEVDRQVTNLSRFELFFPERRQFFIENADLFSTFGLDNINPFFSRRIGLKDGVKTPILGGLRLSGRLDKNWRVGLLSMQTQAKEDASNSVFEPSANYSMLAIQRKVFARSTIGLVAVNRENNIKTANEAKSTPFAYSRLVGIDYNLASLDSKWSGKFFYHRAIQPNNQPGQFAGAALINYYTATLFYSIGYETVGASFQSLGNQMGYVQRQNYHRIEPNIGYTFYPQSKSIINYTIGTDADYLWRRSDNQELDWDFSPLFLRINFKNSAFIRLTPLRFNYTYLFEDFAPTNTGGKKLEKGTSYVFREFRVNMASNARSKVFGTLNVRWGEYFNGYLTSLNGAVNVRYQPYGIFSIDATYNRISLPSDYNSAKLFLIGPRFDVSFSKNLFFTSFFQYDNQRNNLNVNARVQWRFKPVSDMFLVYTENSFVDSATIDTQYYQAFQTKNRALVLKLTYWLNV